jgi:1-acyl-sn-glycerol-3-phosphate acyltransferase
MASPSPASSAPSGNGGEGGSAGYFLVRGLVRFLLALFYRRIEVAGLERVPARGGLVVAANHHNSVVDAMLLLAVAPRRLRTLANAPLFAHPLIGPFLRLLGALPVHRRQEAGPDPARNAALFAATTATLRSGGAILIFPEGRTQPEPVLLELRTGTARMLLAAEDGRQPGVTLLPVGLVFHEPGTFRSGRAVVLIGSPVPTADCVALVRTGSGGEAARSLTERLAGALRGQIVEADDRETLRLLGVVEELWRAEAGAARPAESARVEWLQRAMQAYRLLLAREPDRIAAFRRRLEAFATELDRAGLEPGQVARAYPAGVVARFALREGLALLGGLPLALAGIVVHGVPYQLTGLTVRRMQRTDEEEATDKIAVGLVLYPLAWAAEAWLAYRLGGGWALALLLAALVPVGFFALAWRERLDRVGREAGAFLRFLRDRDLPRRLREERQALAAELAALGRLVPEATD